MKKEIAIAALGELLIDFTEAGISKNGRKLFEQNPGGAPANLLTVASHMGYRTAFIGKIGTDMHGAFLKRRCSRRGLLPEPWWRMSIILPHWPSWKLMKREKETSLLRESRELILSYRRRNWM